MIPLQAGLLGELECSLPYDWCIQLGIQLETAAISRTYLLHGDRFPREAQKYPLPIKRCLADLQGNYGTINKILQTNGFPVQVGLEDDPFSRRSISEVLSTIARYRPDARVLATYIRLGGACMAMHWANILAKIAPTRQISQRQRQFEAENVTGVVEDYLAAASLAAPQNYPLSSKALGWLLQSQLCLLRPSHSSLTSDVVMQILRRAKDHKITVHALGPDVIFLNHPHSRTGEELRTIDIALQGGRYGRQFDLVKAPAARREDLNNALRADIVHFAGHGSGVELIFNGDAVGNSYPLSIVDLGNILQAGKTVKAVVLNACYSSQEAKYLSSVIPVVVSMQGTITDAMAIEFAKHFYTALANGADLLDAFKSGRAMADAVTPVEWEDDEDYALDPFMPEFFERGKLVSGA